MDYEKLYKAYYLQDVYKRQVFICGTEWIVFFFYQIFKRDFPLAAAPYAPGCVYGSVANNSLAKGIVCMPDMFLILFVFGHGKSPFLNNGRGRGCQRRRISAVHLDR